MPTVWPRGGGEAIWTLLHGTLGADHGYVEAFYESPYSDAAPAGTESLFREDDIDLLAEALKRVRVAAMAGYLGLSALI